MSKAKAKGTDFERQVAMYLSAKTGDEVIRRPLEGKHDKGDLYGFRIRGKRTVVECKNHKKLELGQWLNEAEVERGNDDAEYGVVIAKRRGCSNIRIGRSYAIMTLETLAAIACGGFDMMEEN